MHAQILKKTIFLYLSMFPSLCQKLFIMVHKRLRVLLKFLLGVVVLIILIHIPRSKTKLSSSTISQPSWAPSWPLSRSIAGTPRYEFSALLYNADHDYRNHNIDDLGAAKPTRDNSCENDIVRPSNVEWRNNFWQVLQDSGNEIMAANAFFDERPSVGFLPWIRIHNIGHMTETIHCQVWYDGDDFPYIAETVVDKTGRDHTIKNISYSQSLFSCRLASSHPLPTHVSLVVGDKCKNGSMMLPVQYTPRSEYKHEFGICVAIAFGHIPTTVFAEWVEFNRLFGISEINIYHTGMQNMSTVFDYYKKQGLLRTVYMPPALDITNYDTIKLNSPASLNECMMANAYRYRFILVIDFDEFIVPRKHSNYSSLLAAVNERKGQSDYQHTYTARNTYFFRDFSPDPTQPTYMRTARYRKRLEPSKAGLAPKSFIDPRRCVSVFNHWCFILFPHTGPFIHAMDVDLVLSHHYRKCPFGKKKCDAMMSDNVADDIALFFKIPLKFRLDKALREMKAVELETKSNAVVY